MTSLVWTTLHIGGPLPPARQQELCDLLDDEFVDTTVGDIPVEIETAIKESRSLCIQGNVNYGDCEAIEKFCREVGLSYWKHFDGWPAEWEPTIQVWTPRFGERVHEHLATSNTYEPAITLSQLKDARRAGDPLNVIIADLERFEEDSVVPPLTLASAEAPAIAVDA
jgi:hypothetical protein